MIILSVTVPFEMLIIRLVLFAFIQIFTDAQAAKCRM